MALVIVRRRIGIHFFRLRAGAVDRQRSDSVCKHAQSGAGREAKPDLVFRGAKLRGRHGIEEVKASATVSTGRNRDPPAQP